MPPKSRSLQRLGLKGGISLAQVSFAKPYTEHDMNAFTARVQKRPPSDSKSDPPQGTATALSPTAFRECMAYFPDIHVTFPGADAHLHGTDLQPPGHPHSLHREGRPPAGHISRAATGWKSALLKPLTPSFATTTQAPTSPSL
jgi:hypothetical protein